jgi:hypothetical protein
VRRTSAGRETNQLSGQAHRCCGETKQLSGQAHDCGGEAKRICGDEEGRLIDGRAFEIAVCASCATAPSYEHESARWH